MSFSREDLKALLQTELRPGLTIEQATYRHHPQPAPELLQTLNDHKLLRRTGLRYDPARVEDPDFEPWPGAIVLDDARLFKSALPQFAHLIPFFVDGQGVQPFTAGVPRLSTLRLV